VVYGAGGELEAHYTLRRSSTVKPIPAGVDEAYWISGTPNAEYPQFK
jgi:hypothetical protein